MAGERKSSTTRLSFTHCCTTAGNAQANSERARGDAPVLFVSPKTSRVVVVVAAVNTSRSDSSAFTARLPLTYGSCAQEFRRVICNPFFLLYLSPSCRLVPQLYSQHVRHHSCHQHFFAFVRLHLLAIVHVCLSLPQF